MSENLYTRAVTKFGGANFQLWKFQLNAILVASGIQDIVNGTKMEPHEPAEREQWKKDNAKAMFIISTALEDNQLECLLTCTTAAEMWRKLSITHEQASASSKLQLMQKFHEYRMDPTSTVSQHIARVENMARQLSDVGENYSEVAIMAKILGSLSSKFQTFITAWDSVDPVRQTLLYLRERLLTEESRMSSDDVTNALAAVSTKQKTSRSRSVYKNVKHSKSADVNKAETECFYCHKKGHLIRDCYKRKNTNKQRRQPKDDDAIALVASNLNSNEDIRNIWYIDSGASKHISFRRDWFAEFHPTEGEMVSMGDEATCEVRGFGTIPAKRFDGTSWHDVNLENVQYVPGFKKNLLSVGECTQKGLDINFSEDKVEILRKNHVVVSGVKQDNNIYKLSLRPVMTTEANVGVMESLQLWHARLGHINEKALVETKTKRLAKGLNFVSSEKLFCEGCQYGKSHRLPFKKSGAARSSNPGEFIHSDVCGPMHVTSLGGARFFLLFKDDCTGFRVVYFLKNKSEVFLRFKEFESLLYNKFQRSMQRLRIDNGREYLSTEMQQHLREKGVVVEATAPYSPEQNGRSERENRTIVESARAMLCAKNVPQFLWAEAVSTAVYILNRTATSQLKNSTSYEAWEGKKPELSHVRVFGSVAYAHVPKIQRKKLDPKAKKLILVGYERDSANYRLYDSASRKISISRDVAFDEAATAPADTNESRTVQMAIPLYMTDDNESSENEEYEEAEENDQDEPQEETQRLRDRASIRPPQRYEANFVQCREPVTYEEAISGPDAEEWRKAIDEELQAHATNGTWKMVDLPPHRKAIGAKWVFKIKHTVSRNRFKARLCAKGFAQKVGIDYEETFSPVVRYDSVRALLAVAAQKEMRMRQFDVKTAFLNGELHEEIYMTVPEGLEVTNIKKSM